MKSFQYIRVFVGPQIYGSLVDFGGMCAVGLSILVDPLSSVLHYLHGWISQVQLLSATSAPATQGLFETS